MDLNEFIVFDRISNPKRYEWIRLRKRDSDRIYMFKCLKDDSNFSIDMAILQRELRIIEELNIEGVPAPVDNLEVLSKHGILYENFNGQSLRSLVGNHLPDHIEFLQQALAICGVLHQIHIKQLAHKNLNPDTIFYHADNNQAMLTDLVLVSHSEKEYSTFKSALYWMNDLKYISPEQTGRMNRSIDFRSDIYSLGLVFYFMLSGTDTFGSNDIQELTYGHITKIPDLNLLEKMNRPGPLRMIIEKMISKMPEDRYQSILGLETDLKLCLNKFKEGLWDFDFKPGSSDSVSGLAISEKLYGREVALNLLEEKIKSLSFGASGIILVEGDNGTGKSSLVGEVQKNLVQNRIYFVSDTFNQSRSNIPFSAISVAFRNLIRLIAAESEEKIQDIVTEIKNAIGLNLPVLIDYIPELGQLTGASRDKTDLSLSAIETRLIFAFKEFIRIFAKPEHPLVLFLDDVHWGDESSLRLLTDFAGKIDHFLMVLSYRKEGLGPYHPVNKMIEGWKGLSDLHWIHLQNLSEQDISDLLTDTFNLSKQDHSLLTRLLLSKTDGNPMHLKEILKTLHRDQMIEYQDAIQQWVIHHEKFQFVQASGNVLDILKGKIKKLPEHTLEVLQVAACFGFHFDLKAISDCLYLSPSLVLERLQPAIEQELIIPTNENFLLVTGDSDFKAKFRFQHDSLMETVLEASDPSRIPHIHHFAALSKLKSLSAPDVEDQLLEIVNHYNQALPLILDPEERQSLIEFNLRAGIKAQGSMAYNTALGYFKSGIDLLDQESWKEQYDTSYKLYYGLAQNSYQLGQLKDAEYSIQVLLQNVENDFDKAYVLALKSRQYTTLGKTEDAIREGVKGLKLLGISMAENPGQLSVLGEILSIKWKMRGKTAAQLLEHKRMDQKEKTLAAKLLTEIGPAAYILGRENLYALTSLKVVQLSLEYGNCPESSFAYTAYGAVLGEAFGDYKACDDFGQLAVDLNVRLESLEYRCRVIAAYGVLMFHRKNHLKGTTEWFRKGIEAGYASGDLFFLGYCVVNSIYWNNSLPLKKSLEEQLKNIPLLKEINFADASATSQIQICVTKNLLGQTDSNSSLSYQDFDENVLLDDMVKRRYASGIAMYYIAKAEICFLYGQYEEGLNFIQKSEPLLKSIIGLVNVTRWTFLSFMMYSQICLGKTGLEKTKWIKLMRKRMKKVKLWRDFNPVHFEHIYALMSAELAIHLSDHAQVISNFQKSIQHAQAIEYPIDLAIIFERYGRYLLNMDGSLPAISLLQMSHGIYLQMDYVRKSEILKEELDALVRQSQQTFGRLYQQANAGHLEYNIDLNSLMDAANALAGQIRLESLLDKMMRILMMNAGSEKGILFLMDGERLLPKAFAENDQVFVLDESQNTSLSYPKSVINYVAHLKESLVLEDAFRQGNFTNDDYIKTHKIRSVLGTPVIHLNKLYAIIYLENNQMAGAFANERIQLLNLLSSQIAISIQNAVLYESMEEKVAQRTEELTNSYNRLKDTQTQLVQAEKMASLGELTAGIAHEIQNPLNFVNNFADVSAELVDEMNQELKSGHYEDAIQIAEDLKSNLSKINHHGKRADAIVKSMLMHSRRSTGEREWININDLCDEYLRLSYHGLRAKDKFFNSKYELNLAEDLPKISVVPQDIGRVILNLITNAFHAVNEKCKQTKSDYEPRVVVSSVRKGNKIRITVSDNGVGIPEHLKDKIFQPFFTTKPTGQGTGLGLSLSYDIVKAHAGELQVESIEGKGSDFIIDLPLA
ncbi:MAG: AAA family ATPase [Saprospiraceae bacterium]|nr:AAA family ATPase [Saprospiraceae bacterium]